MFLYHKYLQIGGDIVGITATEYEVIHGKSDEYQTTKKRLALRKQGLTPLVKG